MGGELVGVGHFQTASQPHESKQQYSQTQLNAIDKRVRQTLEQARTRAAEILSENRSLVELLRDLLIEKKVIDAKSLSELRKRT